MSSIERNAVVAQNHQDMDLSLYDLMTMAEVAAVLMDDLSSEMVQMEKLPSFRCTQDALLHLEPYRNRLSFAVHHLSSLASDLRRKYDEA